MIQLVQIYEKSEGIQKDAFMASSQYNQEPILAKWKKLHFHLIARVHRFGN